MHINNIKWIWIYKKFLNKIVDNGDSVIVIEYNLDLIKVADHVIDVGRDGGINGGTIIATGTPRQIVANNKDSYTSMYLSKVFN